MRITEAVQHPAPVDDVFTMMTSQEFQDRKCERSGALEHEVTIDLEEGATTVVTRRRMPTEGFPDFAKGFVGEAVDVVESQRWGPADDDGTREAAVEVRIPGTPVEFLGSTWLRPAASGTEHTLDGELRAHVPLLGGKVEKAVAPILSRNFRLEQELAQEWRDRG